MPKETPTTWQREIAAKLGIDISNDSRQVAAGRINDMVESAVHPERSPRSPTARQLELAAEVGIDIAKDRYHTAFSKIHEALEGRSQRLVSEMRLQPGDTVVVGDVVERLGSEIDMSREWVISSIGENGRLYFKGGGGHCAWPSEIKKIVRKGDT